MKLRVPPALIGISRPPVVVQIVPAASEAIGRASAAYPPVATSITGTTTVTANTAGFWPTNRVHNRPTCASWCSLAAALPRAARAPRSTASVCWAVWTQDDRVNPACRRLEHIELVARGPDLAAAAAEEAPHI
jgi:hypothetical protein